MIKLLQAASEFGSVLSIFKRVKPVWWAGFLSRDKFDALANKEISAVP